MMNERVEREGYFHIVFAAPGDYDSRIYKVTYRTETIHWNPTANPNSASSVSETYEYKIGRSKESTITESATETISANIGYSGFGVEASIAASYETTFSAAVTLASHVEETRSTTYNMVMNVPNFLFHNLIDIEYWSGRKETLKGLTTLTNEEGAKPYKRVVTYKFDGTTRETDECLTGCSELLGAKMN
jgi:hypothetical protein